jgi:acetate kinase
MNETQNPFFVLHQELLEQRQLIEKLIWNQTPVSVQHDVNKYEQGVSIACEELGTKAQTIYQNIDKIPHRKIHGKLYFNRVELQEYIRNEGKK